MYQILYNAEHFVVIDKAPEVSFHRDRGAVGVAAALKAELQLEVLYPLHRLDRMTSGLLLFAKDIDSARVLNRQFLERRVEKYYLALSDRKPKKKQGMVRGDMVKARGGSWKLSKSMDNPAATQFFSTAVLPGLRLFLLKPLTGKTHQLRVAMKSLGAPILGDDRYGGSLKISNDASESVDRGYLHAYVLGFYWNGELLRFRSAPTQGRLFALAEVVDALARYREPWSLSWPGFSTGSGRLVKNGERQKGGEQAKGDDKR